MATDKEPESAGSKIQQDSGRSDATYQRPLASSIAEFVDMVRSALFECQGSYFPEWVFFRGEMLARIAADPIGKTLDLGDIVEEWRRYANEVAHVDKMRISIEEREVFRKKYGKRLIASTRIIVQRATTILLQHGETYTDPRVLLKALDHNEEQLQRETYVMNGGFVDRVWDRDE